MEKGIDREMKRGTLEMILLKLLSERPMYGYELITTLEQRGGPPFQLKEGTIYPVLYRLENADLIESHWEALERGVPRKYYQLTPGGVARLAELISDWTEFSAAVNLIVSME
jgi:PadR family transcriptional regulator, regulatory protein PadR